MALTIGSANILKPLRNAASSKKIILHEVTGDAGSYTQTGRRMYVDRDCPIFGHLENGDKMIEEGHGAVNHSFFDAMHKIVDEQDTHKQPDDLTAWEMQMLKAGK